jgi:hypothetical protein
MSYRDRPRLQEPEMTDEQAMEFIKSLFKPREHYYLYRHFDADGTLLYVGMSHNAVLRTFQHGEKATWFHKVVNITIERHPDYDSVIDAERKAIIAEKPLCNRRIDRPKTKKPDHDNDSTWKSDCFIHLTEIIAIHQISRHEALKQMRAGHWRHYTKKAKVFLQGYNVDIRINARDFQEYMLRKGRNYELPNFKKGA